MYTKWKFIASGDISQENQHAVIVRDRERESEIERKYETEKRVQGTGKTLQKDEQILGLSKETFRQIFCAKSRANKLITKSGRGSRGNATWLSDWRSTLPLSTSDKHNEDGAVGELAKGTGGRGSAVAAFMDAILLIPPVGANKKGKPPKRARP